MIAELEKFIGTATKVGNSLMITIPKEWCEFSGIKEKDSLMILFKKVEKKEDDKDGKEKPE